MKRRLSDSEDEEASASKWMQGERQTELERHSNIYDDNRSNAFKGRLPFHKIKGNNTNFPYYRQPREIGFFSLDIERKFLDDKSQLKFYVAPANERDVYFDLKEGFNFMIQKDNSVKEYIDDLLRWILTHKESFILRDEKGDLPTDSIFDSLNTDFVCWRGLLTKLLCTPFERRDGWLIAVVLFGGTYYLCEFETEEKKAEKAKTTKRQQEMCYWGWKFEQYLVSNSPKVPPKTNIAVNNCEAYCTVVRSRLTSHSLVFAGEVDCLNPKSKEACKYVELKTSREIDTRKQDENFKRFKLIKWWAQSFLPGVPEIIAGFRDDSGVVHRLKTYKTMDIPTLVKDIRDPWDAAVCFNFLDRFLSFVKKCVQDDNHRNVYLFSWKPNEDVICEEMGSKSEFSFLPEWYINKIFLQP